MNDSLQQAIMIGVNTLILVIALTVGITLMSSINDLVEYTKKPLGTAGGGSLVESFGETDERTFSGAEVYALYGQYLNGQLQEDIVIEVGTGNISEYGLNYGQNYLNRTFEMIYKGSNKFLFKLKD